MYYSSKRKSDKFIHEDKKKNVITYQEEIKETDYNSEEFFGKPWDQKRLEYRRQSYFRKF